MIRRTASEVLQSLEARVARLEGRTKTSARGAKTLQELAQLMGEKYIAAFRRSHGKTVYWKSVGESLENFVYGKLDSELEIEDWSDLNSIYAAVTGISTHPGHSYDGWSQEEPTIAVEVTFTNSLAGATTRRLSLRMETDKNGNAKFGLDMSY